MTNAQVKADIAANLPDNTSGAITPTKLRTELGAMVDYSDTAAAAAAVAGLDGRTLASRDGSRSSARAKSAYAQSVEWVENWANLTNWAVVDTGRLAVSSGKLIAGSTQDGSSCANRAFVLGAGDTGRVVVAINYVSSLPYGIAIGLSNDVAGAAPVPGLGSFRGLFFTSGQVHSMDKGVGTFMANEPATGDYIATITVDLTYFSVVLTNAAGTVEFQTRFPRSDFTIRNVEVFNTDPREGAGCKIGTIGARKNSATITPRTNIEGIAPTVAWGGNSSASWQVAAPAAYDSQTRSPLVILFHGNGSDETHFTTYANSKVVRDAFLAAGYFCLSVNATTGGGSTWGNQASLDAYFSAYQWCRDHYNVGPVILYGNSMGGLESLLTVAERRIPVAAWIGAVPAVSLASAYTNPTYTDLISAAYSGGSMAGHDPAIMAAADFYGTPMLAIVATDDTSIPPATNWTPFAASLGDYPLEVVTLTTTGGHDASLAGFTAAITAFADKFKA